ncbi:hypothetical protein SMIDD22_02074 [Streptococcus mitis]|uniref:Uncharacterized protein n=1 Tax=Streptococcus mitis TaxID=28037 RepID=A0A139R402_STRMT|nr:hypothetical protein SMIDD22_02074 [Streptococcus mitis]
MSPGVTKLFSVYFKKFSPKKKFAPNSLQKFLSVICIYQKKKKKAL